MDSITKQLLFALLRSAICGTELAAAEKAQISPERLQEMMDISEQNDILHLLALGMKQNAIRTEADAKLKRSISLAIYRYEKTNRRYEKICKALEDAEIPFMPLKGSVIRKYYPEPWMRTSCDIDILVHEADAEKAADLLIENYGFSGKKRSDHDISVFSADRIHLELHYDLIEDGRVNNSHAVMKDVWTAASVRSGCRYLCDMSDEMVYFYHIAHMAKHFEYGGCGIRPFIDLWLLDNRPGADALSCGKLLEAGGLFNLSKTASKLSCVWFSDQEEDEMSARLETFILHGSMYGTEESIHKMKAVHGEKRAQSFLKFIFPSRTALAENFPLLDKCPVLLPYYQVKRWTKIFKKGKRENMKHRLDMIHSLSDQEVDSTVKLMEYFELLE